MTGIPLTDPFNVSIPFELRVSKIYDGKLKFAVCSSGEGRELGPPFLASFEAGDWIWQSKDIDNQQSGSWTIDSEYVDFDALTLHIKNSWLTAGFWMRRADWDAYFEFMAR